MFGFAANADVQRRVWMILVWATLAVMLPLVLEWLGVLAPSIAIENNAIVVHSEM